MMRASMLALGVLLLASRAAAAQGVVKGVVRDSATGELLSGALVDLRDTSLQRTTRTNQRGARMAYLPTSDCHNGWYAEFKKVGDWRVGPERERTRYREV